MSKFAIEIIIVLVGATIGGYFRSFKYRVKGEDSIYDDLTWLKSLLGHVNGKLLHQAMVIIPRKREKALLRRESEARAWKWAVRIMAVCAVMAMLGACLPDYLTRKSAFHMVNSLAIGGFCIGFLMFIYHDARKVLYGVMEGAYTRVLHLLHTLVVGLEKIVGGINWIFLVAEQRDRKKALELCLEMVAVGTSLLVGCKIYYTYYT